MIKIVGVVITIIVCIFSFAPKNKKKTKKEVASEVVMSDLEEQQREILGAMYDHLEPEKRMGACRKVLKELAGNG